jgi:hypothetical protein
MRLQFAAIAILIFFACFAVRFFWLLETDLTIYVSPMVKDLGTFSEESSIPVLAKFRIHNGTNQTVSIVRTMSSCGCTDLQVEKSVLAARESTNLIMKIDPTRFHGPQTITAQIFTDNQAFPHFTVTAVGSFGKANSQGDITISAPSVVVGQQVTWFQPLPDANVSIDWVKKVKSIPGIDLGIEEKFQGYDGKTIALKGTVPTEKGRYEPEIQVKFTEYVEPTTIKVAFQARDRLQVPEKLFAGMVRRGQKFDVDFAIEDLLDERISVPEISVSNSDIVDFSVKPLRGRTNVKLQFAPSRYADGPFQSIATITMKDNVGVVQVVRIPVNGWVLASDSSNSSN